jgi:hypothetical protein
MKRRVGIKFLLSSCLWLSLPVINEQGINYLYILIANLLFSSIATLQDRGEKED